jgi:hypothetical protein
MSFVCRPCNHRRGMYPTGAHPSTQRCPHCDGVLVAVVQPPADGFEHFDHTFTPEHAKVILDRIPSDAYHWADVEREGRVPSHTAKMLAGTWQTQTLERGFYGHPVRFDENGDITHGVMRLMACMASGRPFRTAVMCPTGFLESVLGELPDRTTNCVYP